MENPEQFNQAPEKPEEQINDEKRQLYRELGKISQRLTDIEFQEDSSLLQIDEGLGGAYKENKETLEKHRIEYGEYLIKEARKETGEGRERSLQSLNQVFSLTSLKPEEIATTDEERQQLWEQSQAEIEKTKKGWFK